MIKHLRRLNSKVAEFEITFNVCSRADSHEPQPFVYSTILQYFYYHHQIMVLALHTLIHTHTNPLQPVIPAEGYTQAILKGT